MGTTTSSVRLFVHLARRTAKADWDRNDDLLFAREGRIHRVRFGDEPLADGYGRVRAIADFRDDRFEAIAPSLDAQRW